MTYQTSPKRRPRAMTEMRPAEPPAPGGTFSITERWGERRTTHYRVIESGFLASFSLYHCARCDGHKVALHYKAARAWTGRSPSCCGDVLAWVANVEIVG